MESYSNRREDCWYKDVCQAEVKCDNCIKFKEMSYLMENSNLPKSKQKPLPLEAPECDLKAYKELGKIKSHIMDFVANGGNLYITSDTCGNGKTSWAIKLLLKYFDEIWAGNGFNVRGVFVHVPTLLLGLKDFKTTDENFEILKKRLLEADLVVWDDIASTDMSSYDYSQILTYIDHRLLYEKANIFTGNCADRIVVEEKLGIRMASRLWGNNTQVVIFQGGDRR